MVKITPKRGFKLIFLESVFVYQKNAQPLNDCTQIKIRLSSSYYLKGANMKPKRYPYSGKKKGFTFKVIDLMIDDNSSVESIRNNRLAQIYGLEKEG